MIKQSPIYLISWKDISRPSNDRSYALRDASRRDIGTMTKHIKSLAKIPIAGARSLLIRSRMDCIVLQPVVERECP